MKTKAVGYIRVSTKSQIEKTSLESQKNEIKRYADYKKYEIVEIYEDGGISGATTQGRAAMVQLLNDSTNGKFEKVIFASLDRFGRNTKEILENSEILKEVGVDIISVKEGIDFATPTGKMMLTMLGSIAELERETIKERVTRGKLSKAQQGVPTSGKLPYGRKYDRINNKWGFDKKKKEQIEHIANEFINGESLMKLAKQANMSYENLRTTLINNCGTKWAQTFKDQEPIIFDIPELLSTNIIEQVHARLKHNRINNRKDIENKYLLASYIRCADCGYTLHGTQQHGKYWYYTHSQKGTDCKALRSINLHQIDKAVFETILNVITKLPHFLEAIKESIPDKNTKPKLEKLIKQKEEDKTKIKIDRDKNYHFLLER